MGLQRPRHIGKTPKPLTQKLYTLGVEWSRVTCMQLKRWRKWEAWKVHGGACADVLFTRIVHRAFKLHPCFIPLFRGRLAALESGRGFYWVKCEATPSCCSRSGHDERDIHGVFFGVFRSRVLMKHSTIGHCGGRSIPPIPSHQIHGRQNAHKPDIGTKETHIGDH